MSRKEQGKGMSKGMSPELIEKMLDGYEIRRNRPAEKPSMRPVPPTAPKRRRVLSTAEREPEFTEKNTKPGMGSGPFPPRG